MKNVNPINSPPMIFSVNFDIRYVGFRQYTKFWRWSSSRSWYAHGVAKCVDKVAEIGGLLRPLL